MIVTQKRTSLNGGLSIFPSPYHNLIVLSFNVSEMPYCNNQCSGDKNRNSAHVRQKWTLVIFFVLHKKYLCMCTFESVICCNWCILNIKFRLISLIAVDSKVWDGEKPKVAIALEVSMTIPEGPIGAAPTPREVEVDMLNCFQIIFCKIQLPLVLAASRWY